MNTQTLKDDPDLKLPRVVREAAARSEELHRMMLSQDGQGEVTQEGNAGETPLALESAQPLEGSDPAPAPSPAPSPAPAKGSESDSWEHKYKSLHGRYVQQEENIRRMSEQINSLHGVIATLEAAKAAPAPVEPAPELEIEPLTPEEATDYGDDFLRVVGKRAKAEIAPIIRKLQADNAELRARLDGVSGYVKQTSSQKLTDTLTKELPNWREVNTNQDFIAWLALPDPYSGVIRQNMLTAAYTQGDANRVLAFFNGFLAEEAAMAPAAIEPALDSSVVPKVPLETFAAPGRAKSAAPASGPAEKPVLTRSQISAFYAEVAQGKYRGRDAEKNKLEAIIFDAQREGRIR